MARRCVKSVLLSWSRTLAIILCLSVSVALYLLNKFGSLLYLRRAISETSLGFLLPGSSDAWQNGTLRPHDDFVVPNIAHFIWFSCHEFDFINVLSVISVFKIMKPERILFHTDCEPTGQWWEEAKLIPILEVVHRDPPRSVFGRKLNPKYPEHWSDVARLQILSSIGGVYFDTDIFVVAPLEQLRRYDYVVGRPSGYVLNNGIIFASPNSIFLKIFYESYKQYNPHCYSCNSVFNQHSLASKHKEHIHIENHSLVTPNSLHWKTLFFERFPWQQGHYTFHVWMRAFKSKYPDIHFNPEYIKSLDSSFGEMCRYIYYGDISEIAPGSDSVKPWWKDLKENAKQT
ncbi:uncharacterized protein [Ptychodera flava]|uniref:uncharacterized protein n=1 Tax=Ptychodera flava TaxID=63121 RepID=UPI00396A0154